MSLCERHELTVTALAHYERDDWAMLREAIRALDGEE